MNDLITIVSGLPRSGTSMMMRMIEAGGMEVVVDSRREADEDNPMGYYEFEDVKSIEQDYSWLEGAEGKALKMVSMLLYSLPSSHRYRIVFMRRRMQEILASQRRMLERNGIKSDIEDEEMGRLFGRHLTEIEEWLGGRENTTVLYLSYNDIMEKPQESVKALNEFFENSLYSEKMLQVIDKSLYRQRGSEDDEAVSGGTSDEEREKIEEKLRSLGYM